MSYGTCGNIRNRVLGYTKEQWVKDVTPTTMYAAEWCTLTERCTGATRTVDFAENGSVISILPEEGKQRVHTLILSLYYALSADTVAKELPLLDGALKITTPDFIISLA